MKAITLENHVSPYIMKSKLKISKKIFLAKSHFQSRNFNELDLFRNQIDQSHPSFAQQPYTHKKKSVLLYRAIFFTFAFLFTILGITTMSVPSAISFGFFSTSTTLKGLVITLCTVLSLSSFLLGITMRTDREAVIHCLEVGRRNLHTTYLRKKIQLGIMRFFTIFGPQRRQAKALLHMYKDVWEKMNDKKEEALHLITRISSLKDIDANRKELLLNQAVAELHDNISKLVHAFKHSDPTT